MGGPRGLIRIGEPSDSSTSTPYLFNFIAIEPVLAGATPRHSRTAFSELERSRLDLQQGKRLSSPRWQGDLQTSGSEEILTVPIEVEPFDNGAHVWLEATISTRRPAEICFTVHPHLDSVPLQEITLTATMGNKARVRQLWLRDAIIDSRQLYAGFSGNDFVEKQEYPARRLLDWNGRPTMFLTSNEPTPQLVHISRRSHWNYNHRSLTQYWAYPASQDATRLRARVNGRRVYWLSQVEIPGGIAFENFELRAPYHDGQSFIFGITPTHPDQLLDSPPSSTPQP